MNYACGIRTCSRCHGELTESITYVGRTATGGGYKRVHAPCPRCQFRILQLPAIARARTMTRMTRRRA